MGPLLGIAKKKKVQKYNFVCVSFTKTGTNDRARPGQHIEMPGLRTRQQNGDRNESIPSTSSPPLPPFPETCKTISPSSSSSYTQTQWLCPKLKAAAHYFCEPQHQTLFLSFPAFGCTWVRSNLGIQKQHFQISDTSSIATAYMNLL